MPALESRRDGELSLPEFLSDRARHSSDARLALDAGIGFVFAISAALWHGRGWHLIASAGICFLAYGLWGIADRELLDQSVVGGARQIALKAGRILAAVVGGTATVFFVLALLALALGRIIS